MKDPIHLLAMSHDINIYIYNLTYKCLNINAF